MIGTGSSPQSVIPPAKTEIIIALLRGNKFDIRFI